MQPDPIAQMIVDLMFGYKIFIQIVLGVGILVMLAIAITILDRLIMSMKNVRSSLKEERVNDGNNGV